MVNLDNLFLRIKELKLTAKKLSDDTGISTGNISDWKSGRSMPTALKLVVLADYLDCSVDYLLGRTDEVLPEGVKPLTEKQKAVLLLAEQFSEEDIKKLIEYAEILKRADKK